MEVSEYKNIYENENSHFFYVANHKIILSQVKKYLRQPQREAILQILDAGCGSGLLAKKLSRFGNVVGVDISPHALNLARKRGINVKKASINSLPFKAGLFDLVVCVDVIYHQSIQDDNKPLKEFNRVLNKGGILIIRVPANKWLTRSADEFVHTRQRYDYGELKKKVVQAGFKVEAISYVNMLLFPPAVVSFLWEKISLSNKSSPLIKLPSLLNKFIGFLLSLEADIINKINFPFGLGLLVIARKT